MLNFKEWYVEDLSYINMLSEKQSYCPNQTKEEKEYSDWEDMMNKTWETIGHIGSYEVIRSGHFDTPRYPDTEKCKMTFVKMREEGYPLRGDNLSNKTLLDVIKKTIEKDESSFNKFHKTLIIYKNKKGTWDALSVRNENKKVSIITSMQSKKSKPYYNPQTGQNKVIVEGENIIFNIIEIELD